MPFFDGADQAEVGEGAEKVEDGCGNEDLPVGEIVRTEELEGARG